MKEKCIPIRLLRLSTATLTNLVSVTDFIENISSNT